ncbi:DUF7692 domain-containing protein [Natrarchaeobaculum sulfurireducens]|nr:hypothetical protein AArcMg_2349 [Natrarchaeobaculum sulfurireducens]
MLLVTNMAHNETPGSVRIHTAQGNEWCYNAIEKAARFYDCNRSNAIAFACEAVNRLVRATRAVLERDNLTRS